MKKIVALTLSFLSLPLIASDPEKVTRKRLDHVTSALYQLECAIDVPKPDIEWINKTIAQVFLDLGPLGKQTEFKELFEQAITLNEKLTVLLQAQQPSTTHSGITITISES